MQQDNKCLISYGVIAIDTCNLHLKNKQNPHKNYDSEEWGWGDSHHQNFIRGVIKAVKPPNGASGLKKSSVKRSLNSKKEVQCGGKLAVAYLKAWK